PSPSKTRMQCSQRASTPKVLPARSHASMPPSAGWPLPPFPGGLATVASRHGSRPTGKEMLGAIFIVIGRLMAGSSPRCRTKMRLGLSAKTLWPAPNVHPSCPGREARSLGQPATTSYAPKMSCPPFWPGTAAVDAACRPLCADRAADGAGRIPSASAATAATPSRTTAVRDRIADLLSIPAPPSGGGGRSAPLRRPHPPQHVVHGRGIARRPRAGRRRVERGRRRKERRGRSGAARELGDNRHVLLPHLQLHRRRREAAPDHQRGAHLEHTRARRAVPDRIHDQAPVEPCALGEDERLGRRDVVHRDQQVRHELHARSVPERADEPMRARNGIEDGTNSAIRAPFAAGVHDETAGARLHTVPLTGQSRSTITAAASRLRARAFAAIGSVLVSTTIRPRARAAARLPAVRSSASTEGSAESTTGADSATPDALAATRPPRRACRRRRPAATS